MTLGLGKHSACASLRDIELPGSIPQLHTYVVHMWIHTKAKE
jgi:hypothetical protein